jgi:hypothetical protein
MNQRIRHIWLAVIAALFFLAVAAYHAESATTTVRVGASHAPNQLLPRPTVTRFHFFPPTACLGRSCEPGGGIRFPPRGTPCLGPRCGR